MSAQRLLGISMALAVTAAGSTAFADAAIYNPSNASCCVQSTSYLDSLMQPVKGGDEDFFTRPGGPPNLMFILDTSGSMASWPVDWPSTQGCGDPTLNSLGYDPNTTYPGLYDSVTASDPIDHDWFNNNKYYPLRNGGYGTDFAHQPYMGGWSAYGAPWGTADDACNGYGDPEKGACKTCLATEGYYIHGWNDARLSGNFLNFYAPRDSGMVIVLSQIVHDVADVRFGLISYGTSNGNTCFTRTNGDGSTDNEICMFQTIGPKCGDSFPLDKSSVDSQRNSILNNLQNQLGWHTDTPSADALFAAMEYFRGSAGGSNDPFPAGNTNGAQTGFFADFPNKNGKRNYVKYFDEQATTDQKSVCYSCNFNAVVYLTDGEPCNEGTVVNIPSEITSAYPSTDCPGCGIDVCNAHTPKLWKVAKWFWNHDDRWDLTSDQKIATYTIGFSQDAANSENLKYAAQVGGGRFYPATSTTQLKQRIHDIIDDVISRNASFSAATVSSIQTSDSLSTSVVPRFFPQGGNPWTGQLFKFQSYNEFVQDTDYNGNGTKTDLLLVDKDGSVVTTNSNGDFIKSGSVNPAKPYWEARAQLTAKGYANRKIYTVVDSSGDGLYTEADNTISFDVSNLSTLMPYLGIQDSELCPTITNGTVTVGNLISKMGVSLSGALTIGQAALGSLTLSVPPTQDELNKLCGALLIQYIRGQDLFDENQDNLRTDTRISVLGDIFHSSPVNVDPPSDPFVCTLGLSNQCVRTLYATPNYVPQLPSGYTPLDSYAMGEKNDCTGAAVTRDAYAKYQHDNQTRQKLVIVGANDGMLHAFDNGSGSESCDASQNPVVTYDQGTGNEVWAFIPPDLLPRLQQLVTDAHVYMVDGDTMVRDIWYDTNGDGKKQYDEFHTVAILADGRGGTGYTALDVTSPSSPKFRWTFPQPCSQEATLMGKTLFSLAPKPPPIGPVLLKASSLSPAPAAGANLTPAGLAERWVAMLSGGWATGLEKGRGIYMVDVWKGQVNGRHDNIYWRSTYKKAAAGDQDTPRGFMTASIAAPVAMVDYGANNDPKVDGFFDTGIVGDTAGQIWVARWSQPGVVDSTTHLVNNWAMGRAFQMDLNGDTDPTNPDHYSDTNQWPFFYVASTALQATNNALRVFEGTGNRYDILQPNAGTCRFDNPQACSKYGCDDVHIHYDVNRLNQHIDHDEAQWHDSRFDHADQNPITDVDLTQSFCGNPGEHPVDAKYGDYKINHCPKVSGGGTQDFGDVLTPHVQCGRDKLGAFTCQRMDSTVDVTDDLAVGTSYMTSKPLGLNRFFGIWAYGASPTREFDETLTTAPTAPANSAKTFDAARISDRTAAHPNQGDLTNVSTTTCTSANVCTGPAATPDGYGWFLEYQDTYPTLTSRPASLAQKTASGAATLAGCVQWSSLFPNATSTTACGASTLATSRFTQADYITGQPNCAVGFKDLVTAGTWSRYKESSTVAPPPEPATTIQISKTGQIHYGVQVGNDQTTTVSDVKEPLQQVYQLPVTRDMHYCRHTGDGSQCLPNPP